MSVYRKHNSINSAQHKSTYATREPVKQPAQTIKPIACNSTLSAFPNPYYLKNCETENIISDQAARDRPCNAWDLAGYSSLNQTLTDTSKPSCLISSAKAFNVSAGNFSSHPDSGCMEGRAIVYSITPLRLTCSLTVFSISK